MSGKARLLTRDIPIDGADLNKIAGGQVSVVQGRINKQHDGVRRVTADQQDHIAPTQPPIVSAHWRSIGEGFRKIARHPDRNDPKRRGRRPLPVLGRVTLKGRIELAEIVREPGSNRSFPGPLEGGDRHGREEADDDHDDHDLDEGETFGGAGIHFMRYGGEVFSEGCCRAAIGLCGVPLAFLNRLNRPYPTRSPLRPTEAKGSSKRP